MRGSVRDVLITAHSRRHQDAGTDTQLGNQAHYWPIGFLIG
jgi:hypothetical protein